MHEKCIGYIERYVFLETAPIPPTTNSSAGLESINVITNAVGPRSLSLREMMRRAVRTELNNSNSSDQHGYIQEEPLPTHINSWPPESFDVTSGDEDSLMGLGSSANNKGTSNSMPSLNNTSVLDPNERRNNAMQILHDLLYESTALAPHLVELLCAK